MSRAAAVKTLPRERKLKSRKRRKQPGHIIRLSKPAYEALDKLRRGKSWDALIRRYVGLPDRNGNKQPLIEGVLETMTGHFFLRTPDVSFEELETQAYEVAIRTAARTKARVSRPLCMRELP